MTPEEVTRIEDQLIFANEKMWEMILCLRAIVKVMSAPPKPALTEEISGPPIQESFPPPRDVYNPQAKL
jgi:hypothetical protein